MVPLSGPWTFKDRDLMDEHVLDAGRRWWDEQWSVWSPDPSWRPVTLPQSWASLTTTMSER